jgi:hypothetical protein
VPGFVKYSIAAYAQRYRRCSLRRFRPGDVTHFLALLQVLLGPWGPPGQHIGPDVEVASDVFYGVLETPQVNRPSLKSVGQWLRNLRYYTDRIKNVAQIPVIREQAKAPAPH